MSTPIATLSTPRFATYLTAALGDQDRAIELYQWNAEIGAAFHLPLQAWEVALRNACHTEMTRWQQRPDWWTTTSSLSPAVTNAVRLAQNRLNREGHPATPDRTIAGIMLGGWCDLLANVNHLCWVKALHHAWPYKSRRADVHATAQRLRELRNRIYHHEPLINRPLQHRYDELLTATHDLNPDLHTWITTTSTVPATLARRP